MALVEFDTKRKIPTDLFLTCDNEKTYAVGNLYPTFKKNTYIISGFHKAKYLPKVTADRLIVFPKKVRILLEDYIETFCNIVAISLNCSRNITSGRPMLAMKPETHEDLSYLSQVKGFYVKQQNCVVNKGKHNFDTNIYLPYLTDRMDGVALLAEALHAKSATAQVHEFIRLFERALSLSGRKLIEPLTAYFAGTIFGYTAEEIKNWIKIRDGATHADARNEFYINGDCGWYVSRLEQAAYDLLLNKLSWRTPNLERRNIWVPDSGTTNDDSDIYLRNDRDFESQMQVFDEFRRFHMHLEGTFDVSKLNLWTGPMVDRPDDVPSGATKLTSGLMRVLAGDDQVFAGNLNPFQSAGNSSPSDPAEA
ncbi:hypothetical protein R1A27_28345 [Methylobacterium sp. NMS12]|uniref:hypothetical protein n=1 Tax=Methylobacterium sp. NMS12 TaxID=3079766 RepID=UPI003F882C04